MSRNATPPAGHRCVALKRRLRSRQIVRMSLIISEFNLGSVQDPTGPSTHHKQLFFHSLPSVSFLRKGIVLSLSPPPASSGGRGSDGAEGDDNLKTFSAKFVS